MKVIISSKGEQMTVVNKQLALIIEVDLCLMALNMKGDEVMSLRPVDSNRSVPLPEVITVPWPSIHILI